MLYGDDSDAMLFLNRNFATWHDISGQIIDHTGVWLEYAGTLIMVDFIGALLILSFAVPAYVSLIT